MEHAERDFEKRCIAMARKEGWSCWKNEKNGNKGIPDFSLLHPDGRFLLVEFKRPDGGGRLSPMQQVWIDRFPDVVKVIDSLEDFKAAIGYERDLLVNIL